MEDSIKLIDGTYTANEAAEILYSVVNDKIKFHNIQVNSCNERNVGDLFHSEKRLAELAVAKEKIAQLLEQARQSGEDLSISADIEVKLLVNQIEEPAY